MIRRLEIQDAAKIKFGIYRKCAEKKRIEKEWSLTEQALIFQVKRYKAENVIRLPVGKGSGLIKRRIQIIGPGNK